MQILMEGRRDGREDKKEVSRRREPPSYLDNIDDDEDENNRGDFFSLPSLGLNYLNNLNLNLSLKNTSLWRIYENSIQKHSFSFSPRRTLDDLFGTNEDDFEALLLKRKKEVEKEKKHKQTLGDHDDLHSNSFWEEEEETSIPNSPFHHRIKWNFYERFKIGLMSVTIAPLRVIGVFAFLVLAWLLATIGMVNLTFEESQKHPYSNWRRRLREFIAHGVMRSLFFCAGFHWVKVKGRQANAKEAPILAVAPHSTYFDAFPLIMMGAPSVVAKSSVRNVHFFGKLVDMTQPVYVSRSDPESRQNSIKEITNRAKSDEKWPQIYIYPEGTCSNRSGLVNFKAGAFLPGMPVQPVIVRYPNRFDVLTWTFDGPPATSTIWYTLCQFHNKMEIEYLPVYRPSEEEKADHKLFAKNVQKQMALAIGVPVTNYTFEDGAFIAEMGKSTLAKRLTGLSNLRKSIIIEKREELKFLQDLTMREEWNARKISPPPNIHSEELNKLLQPFITEDDLIDVRNYIFSSLLLNGGMCIEKMSAVLFHMYSEDKLQMRKEEFMNFLAAVFGSKEEEGENVYEGFGSTKRTNRSIMDLREFREKMFKRLECAKWNAMEIGGKLKGEFPLKERRPKSISQIMKEK